MEASQGRGDVQGIHTNLAQVERKTQVQQPRMDHQISGIENWSRHDQKLEMLKSLNLLPKQIFQLKKYNKYKKLHRQLIY